MTKLSSLNPPQSRKRKAGYWFMKKLLSESVSFYVRNIITMEKGY
jgi:hypothetical protein